MEFEQRLPAVDGDDGQWGDLLNQFLEKEHYNTGIDDPDNGSHKTINLQPGTAAPNTAPLKFSSGPLMTNSEPGAMEFLGDKYYLTQTTNAVRKVVATGDTNITVSTTAPASPVVGDLWIDIN